MTHLSPNFDPSHTPESPIQQVLAELGIAQLLSLIQHHSDIDFDAAQMHLTDAEAHAIAALFIQQLTESLNGKLIAGALNTLRHSEEIEDVTQEDGRVLPPSWVKQFLFVPKPAPTHSTLNDSPHEDEDNLYRYPTHLDQEIEPLLVRTPTGRYHPKRPHNPRPITQREQYIIDLYCYCKLKMTPKKFYAKWGVTYEQISHICFRSLGTVQCWFNRGQDHRSPQPVDLRQLTIVDFLLDHYEELPQSLIDLLCSP
ncbi:hypothetical protein MC7420_126 [Coleofasciculus chthonoplastes PCC 7420]|uniref:Uncharacterized protein n=1 Tax=Coleofasciculus chthonoplastes PCC 7420 TaxID=118168 RepID=B4W4Q6_9CYAN|nr:hypothetical protein [Coleofasciculus chthonoplastes]EDX70837.1 hypothetical protein MC7420_126 [Coleofasciculus chthonoplastes PCC 7420]